MATQASKKAIKVKAKINTWGTFSGKKITPIAVNYSRQLNAPPSLSLDFAVTQNQAENKAEETKSTSIIERLGTLQKESFAGKIIPDAELSLYADAEASDTMEFKGFVCDTSISVSPANITNAGGAIIQWAEFEALDYSIYGLTEENTAVFSTGVEGESIIDIIKNLEKKLYESWTKEVYEKKKTSDPHQAEVAKKVHERNTRLRPYFERILDESKDTIGWEKINKYLKENTQKKDGSPVQSLRNAIATCVCKILQNGSGSFLGKVLMIGELFQCVFVPSKEPDFPGKYINKAYAVGGTPKKLKLDVLTFSGKASSVFGLLPVSSIYIKPPPSSNTAEKDKNKVIYAPKEAAGKGGAQIPAAAPEWWFSALNTIDIDLLETAIEKEPDAHYSSMATKVFPDIEKKVKSVKDYVDAETQVAYVWSMILYAWSSLATSTASISVPGTFKIEPGKRYEVQNKKGKKLFTGFLTGFSTNISTGSGLTNLVFSHIMFPGFKLPGEDELKAAGIIS